TYRSNAAYRRLPSHRPTTPPLFLPPPPIPLMSPASRRRRTGPVLGLPPGINKPLGIVIPVQEIQDRVTDLLQPRRALRVIERLVNHLRHVLRCAPKDLLRAELLSPPAHLTRNPLTPPRRQHHREIRQRVNRHRNLRRRGARRNRILEKLAAHLRPQQSVIVSGDELLQWISIHQHLTAKRLER